jgi:hypothetical protein
MSPAELVLAWETMIKRLARNLFFCLALSPKLPSVNSLTGGTSTDLDGYVTVGKETPIEVTFKHNATDAWLTFILDAGTDVEDVPFIVRPDDYATTTNEKVCRLKSVNKGGNEYVYNVTTQDFHAVILTGSGGSIQHSINETGITIS